MTKVVGIVPWGDVIEDYLDPIGLSLEAFADEMSGGWLFGYVQALQAVGCASFVLAPSRRVTQARRLVHAATGCPIWLVPGRSCQRIRNPELRAVRQWLTTPVRAMREILRRERCDLLLVQDYERPQFDALTWLGRSARIPVFATFQGGDQTLSRIERPVRGPAIRRSAGLIVAAAAERARLIRDYGVPADRIADIPNPIDLSLWNALPRSEARASLGLDPAMFVAVTHGRIDIHRKGLDLLLSAWSGPGLLVLIGGGQDRDRFREMVQGRADVRWIDSYTNDRELIRRWLSAADLYISASRLEGMPVAPLEAMSCGVPVIASTAKGLKDIFPEDLPAGGLLFPSGEGQALSQAIDRMRADPGLRRHLGGLARAIAEQRYSLASVGQSLLGFFSSPAVDHAGYGQNALRKRL